ncbi:MAG: esterase family protein [Acidobacteria bacterium]|nr:esterase family protein [Acidobacteriota bacterium]MBI3421323.1 esterase family protein [Acidobacteriota bacterium]
MNTLKTLTLALCLAALTALAQDAPLTPLALEKALLANPTGEQAEQLAARLRQTFGAEMGNLAKLPGPKIDELTVAWAIEIPNQTAAPQIVTADGGFTFRLTRVGTTNVYAGVKHFNWGDAALWQYELTDATGTHRVRAGTGQLETYTTPPEMKEQPGVPKGKLIQMPKWTSKVFADTTRDWWVYVPAQYNAAQPAAVMVWQDGQNARNYVPVVFDNLIAKGEVPVTVSIFLAPGTKSGGQSNRSFEYDTLSDQYVRFLLEEILPEVEKTYPLRHDAASRAIAGLSSGGICAFTAAWERPNEFHKVLSWIGSFTNIAAGPTVRAGGHNYEAMIRKTPRKPIRVFLQDGSNDLDNNNGNWPLANQTLAKSLAFAGYDYRFVFGHGFHSDRHGRAVLPDSLRWLWRDYQR